MRVRLTKTLDLFAALDKLVIQNETLKDRSRDRCLHILEKSLLVELVTCRSPRFSLLGVRKQRCQERGVRFATRHWYELHCSSEFFWEGFTLLLCQLRWCCNFFIGSAKVHGRQCEASDHMLLWISHWNYRLPLIFGEDTLENSALHRRVCKSYFSFPQRAFPWAIAWSSIL